MKFANKFVDNSRAIKAGLFAVVTLAVSVGCHGVVDVEVANDSEDSFEADYEAYRSRFVVEHNGLFRVEGDMLFADEDDVREYFQTLKGAEGALTVNVYNGSWDLWPSSQRQQLGYCVSDKFGASKQRIVEAMWDAARQWERAANVRFHYVPGYDHVCEAIAALRVLGRGGSAPAFRVNPVWEGDEGFLAHASFPYFSDDMIEVNMPKWTAGFPTPGLLESVMLHEIGHLLGFPHEHRWSEETAKDEGCKNSIVANDVEQLTTYDKASVMHYNGCGGGAGYWYSLSARDVQGVQKAYGKPERRKLVAYRGLDRFLRADNGGYGTVDAKATQLGPWEEWEAIFATGNLVRLRSRTKTFLRSDSVGNLFADTTSPDDGTLFQRVPFFGKIALKSVTSNKYITFTNAGAASGMSSEITGNTLFDEIELDARRVAFAGRNGDFLRATEALSYSVELTNRIDARAVFSVVDLGDEKIALRNRRGFYLSAQNGGGSSLELDRDVVGAWETFTLHRSTNDDRVQIETHNGHYLFSYNTPSTWDLFAYGDASWPAVWTTFRMIEMSPDTVAIKSVDADRWWAAEDSGGRELNANRTWIQAWEIFQLIEVGPSQVAIKTANGNFVTVKDDDSLASIVDWIDTWEIFDRVVDKDGHVRLRSKRNGKYVCGLSAKNQLFASCSATDVRSRMSVVDVF